MQCLVLSMRTGSGMSHLQFQQLLPWAAVPVCVAFVAPHKCGDEHRGRSHNSPCAHFVRASCALTGAVKLLSLQVERWSRSAFVMRGYTVTALRDAAPHKDWFTELMGTCAQHMAMLERSESHSAAGAHGDLAAKKPPHIAHTCTHTPWSCWGILKLRTTTLAPRYIFESATKCVCGWDVVMRDIRRSAIVWKCPGTPTESKEMIRATCWDETQQQEVHSLQVTCWFLSILRSLSSSSPSFWTLSYWKCKIDSSESSAKCVWEFVYTSPPRPRLLRLFFLSVGFPPLLVVNGILKMLATRCRLDWDS